MSVIGEDIRPGGDEAQALAAADLERYGVIMDYREATLHVFADGTVTIDLPEGLAPGDYAVQIPPQNATLHPKNAVVMTKISTAWIDEWPKHDGPWDDSTSLRREDIYGDDGR
jgi:hypothetical protein